MSKTSCSTSLRSIDCFLASMKLPVKAVLKNGGGQCKLLVDFVSLSMLSSANVDSNDLKEFFRATSTLTSE